MSLNRSLETVHPVEIRIRQLASAIQIMAQDSSNLKVATYQASLDAMRTLWNEAMDAAADAVKPIPGVQPESSWERGYWAAENTSAHKIMALKTK